MLPGLPRREAIAAIDEIVHEPTRYVMQTEDEDEGDDEGGCPAPRCSSALRCLNCLRQLGRWLECGAPVIWHLHAAASHACTASPGYKRRHAPPSDEAVLRHAVESEGDVREPVQGALQRLYARNEQPFRDRVQKRHLRQEYDEVNRPVGSMDLRLLRSRLPCRLAASDGAVECPQPDRPSWCRWMRPERSWTLLSQRSMKYSTGRTWKISRID